VLVVGGGITGAGLALDLRLRGLEVALVERGDWANATSSASSRLIHGGLRYLELGDYALVRDSCLERALLLELAAGLVWPEQFLYALRRGESPGRVRLAAGLALYTALSLPRPLGVARLIGAAAALRRVPQLERAGLLGGGSYLDGATHDARLALAVVASASAAGACCVSRVELLELEQGSSGVRAHVRDVLGERSFALGARACVLAGGPSTEELRARAGLTGAWIQPTRGAHIAVPRERLPTDGAVILRSAVDGRVLFLLPWPEHTVIGTTDLDAPAGETPRATRAEVRYLLDSANGLAPGAALNEADVCTSWAGLRPLLAAYGQAPSQRSREERVEREGSLYTIAGGKLTGYRSMAERLGARIARELGRGQAQAHSPTRTHRLWGALAQRVARPAWSALDARGQPRRASEHELLEQRYGSFAGELAARRAASAAAPLALGAHASDLRWSVEREDCLRLADFLWRRCDLGHAPRAQLEPLLPRLADELAALLGSSAAERSLGLAEAREQLERAHAWRLDPA
jgi:glycerol-3-phosphate dehydrogenase